MARLSVIVAASFLVASSALAQEGGPGVGQNRVAPALLALSGIAIAGLWTVDLASGEKFDSSEGALRLRDRETGQIMLPHLIAEYGTAAALLVSSYGLATDQSWGRSLALVSAGALAYTSTNSLSWTVSKEGRLAYAIPMILSLAGAGASVVILF